MNSFKKPVHRRRSHDGEKEQAQISGGQIRHHRLKRGFTQTELGNMLGVSRQQVKNYESGVGLSWTRGVKIAQELGISLIELAGHNGTAKSKPGRPQESNHP